MIRTLSGTRDDLLSLDLSGTVIEADLDPVLGDWLTRNGDASRSPRLVLTVHPDFDGYDAEIVHALGRVGAWSRHGFDRIAVIAGETLSPFARTALDDAVDGDLRFFAPNETADALVWAAA